MHLYHGYEPDSGIIPPPIVRRRRIQHRKFFSSIAKIKDLIFS